MHSGGLFERATSPVALSAALDQMAAEPKDSWSDGLTRLIEERADRLPEASQQLVDGTFRWEPLVEMPIPKDGGGERLLQLPRLVERVIERSINDALWPLLDGWLGTYSYGFRPGLGTGDAMRRVVQMRDEGNGWVARVDIDDCFPTIDRHRLLRLLRLHVDDVRICDAIEVAITRPVRAGKRLRRPVRGLPQGSPLSPLLANVALAEFDEHLAREGFAVVRYADDVVIGAADRPAAERAVEAAAEAAATIGQRIGADKVEVVDFTTGFAFLGEEFNDRYPPPTDVHRLDDVDRRTLYVGTQGAYVSVRLGRVVVSKDKAELLSVPTGHVARIVSFGGVTLAPGLVSWAMNTDVDVVLCSRRGTFHGWLSGGQEASTSLRRTQFRRSDDPSLCVAFGAAVERGKLHNQRVTLQRARTPESARALAEPIEQIAALMPTLASCATRDEVMGVEGLGARWYFEALVALLPAEIGFRGRQRRPPNDVVNAALGYGYAILHGEAVTACAAAGLDPAVGFLHADHDRRMSLALDLMEEFRPLIVDAAVLALVRGGSLTAESARPSGGPNGGILLTEAGRMALTAEIERRLLTVAMHVPSRRNTSYRRMIHLQAQQVARMVRTGVCDYEPVLRRV